MASCSFSEEMFLKTQTFMGVSYLPPGSPTAIIQERVITDLSQCAGEVVTFLALSALSKHLSFFLCWNKRKPPVPKNHFFNGYSIFFSSSEKPSMKR
jgi:hypothetical protein